MSDAVLPNTKLDQIQVLRAFAALSVVVGHIPMMPPGGFGVDMFFIISGFIMPFVTQRDARHFVLKRLFRVVPLYWLGTIGIFCLALAAPSLLRTATADPEYLLKSLFFIPFRNGGEVRPLLVLGWTLNYEMFFYALFGLAMALSHRYRTVLCAGFLFAIVACGRLFAPSDVVLGFYANPIILEFIYGMAAFELWRRFGTRIAPGKPGAYVCIALGLAIYLSLNILHTTLPRIVEWGLPCLATFLIVLFCAGRVALPKALVMLGDASYSLYLFHPYVIYGITRLVIPLNEPTPSAIAVSIFAVILCVLCAVASWWFIEAPSNLWLRKRFLATRAQPPRAPVFARPLTAGARHER
jgi:peptidoglycan/LPS O-acetylase OafA/YrhL